MGTNVARQLLESHLVAGHLAPGEEIGLRIDQTLTQDATGTLVMLELEAMGLDRVRTELSVQYVDHNLIQEDNRNADDHLFLLSACQRFGVWFSRPGNGVSHPVHQERFGVPGKTLLGADSHTPAAGALGMLAIGAGGLEVALAMAGEPFHVAAPSIWGVRLVGELPPWVSAKDVILELLRRHGVAGGRGFILEYLGPGLDRLSAMDRHVIANMGAELGATTTVFPSDGEVRRFLERQGRGADWVELVAAKDATYDREEEIDLARLEPLIALPSSPGNVRPVREVAGEPVYQCYIGSSANPGFRDLAVAAEIVRGRRVAPRVSFDINPASRQVLLELMRSGHLQALLSAGARLHQTGCNGCIGMGQAPATHENSLRTVPRNFPGRSGTKEDRVFLVSPETAAASALAGAIRDPRDVAAELSLKPQTIIEPPAEIPQGLLLPPLDPESARRVELRRGPNIAPLPQLEPLPDRLELPVLLKVGDDLSTDEILPAGARVLPLRSNIPRIAEYCFTDVDPSYVARALAAREAGGHAIVGGANYGQGSSREHAALAPRWLGLRAVIAKSFARIHGQNLVNFGVLPLVFEDPKDGERIEPGEHLVLEDLHRALGAGAMLAVTRAGGNSSFLVRHMLSPRQLEVLLAGGLIDWIRPRLRR